MPAPVTETQSTNDPTGFLTLKEASRFLKLQPGTVISYATAGKIRAAFFCRRWRFLQSDLLAFAAESGRGKR